MVELKKTAGTLDELRAREDEIKTDIKELTREKKSISGTIKSFLKLIGSDPKPAKKHAKKKRAPRKSVTAATA